MPLALMAAMILAPLSVPGVALLSTARASIYRLPKSEY
jgi:hypothetical protein